MKQRPVASSLALSKAWQRFSKASTAEWNLEGKGIWGPGDSVVALGKLGICREKTGGAFKARGFGSRAGSK